MWVPRIIHLNRFFHCEPGSYWGTSIYNDPYFTTCCNGWTNLDASTHATPQNFTNMMISYDLTINIHHPSSSINHWEDQQISGYITDHATSCILKIWGLHFSLCLDVPRHHWLAGSSCVQHTPTTHKRTRMDPSGNGIHIMYNYI